MSTTSIYRQPVNVPVIYGQQNIATENFNVPMILVTANYFSGRTGVITSASDLLNVGASETDPAYIMATAIFNGVGKPVEIIVGQRKIVDFELTLSTSLPATIATGTKFGFTINSNDIEKPNNQAIITYTSVANDTTETVYTGLTTALNAYLTANTSWADVIDSSSSTATDISIKFKTGKTGSVAANDNMVLAVNATETYEEALTACKLENSVWFDFCCESHDIDDITAISAFTELSSRKYYVAVQDMDVANNVSGNIAEVLGQKSYKNTSIIWYSTADTTYIEAAVIGSIVNFDKGVTGYDYKTYTGFLPDDAALTPTIKQNLTQLNVSFYETQYGKGVSRGGFSIDGTYSAEVDFVLWMQERIKESLFSLLYNRSMKGSALRFTDADGKVIQAALTANPIKDGLNNGTISSYKITVPKVATLDQADIAAGLFKGIIVEVTYSRPISNLDITLVVDLVKQQ